VTDSARKPRVEVLCLTYGEPAENEFWPQYEYSLNILNKLTRRVAPIPKLVTPLLAARRGRARAAMFNEMDYHSPLEEISAKQAEKIGARLREMDPSRDYHVRVVTEFRPPMLPQILDELATNPPDELVMLPLYVAESDFTTGISRTDLQQFHHRRKGRHGLPAPLYVGGFGFDDRMARVFVDFVLDYCRAQGWDEARMKQSALVLGAHGTLVYPPEGINSGARETLYFFGLMRRHLLPHFATIRVAWLNHTLGGKWTFPAADECGGMIHEQGFRDVVYFPFGFMGDNNESQNEGREALKDFEWNELLYLPCPNEDDRLCNLLAEMTIEHLNQPKREDWDHVEEGGRRDLVQGPRPAVEGTPGFLKFTSPTLGALSLIFWALIGTMLVWRAGLAIENVASPVSLGLALFFAIVIGAFKGTRVFAKIIPKNLKRLRSLPQPSFITRTFSKAGYIVMLVMMTFGISVGLGLRALDWWGGYVAILGGVGLAMWVGVIAGIRHFRLCVPVRIIPTSGPLRWERAAKPSTGEPAATSPLMQG
jgi:ferrochelatase